MKLRIGLMQLFRIILMIRLVSENKDFSECIVSFAQYKSFSFLVLANEEAATILGAMQEYHNKTCIRFRPYQKDDKNWIDIRSDSNGCWSSVGMKEDGQVVNLSSPKCIRHGVVAHELMHAVGFYHQHSAPDRDDFVEIMWDNIVDGRENNFNKYNDTTVSEFNVTYDYDSVMHYSSKAFSRNGENTIEPLVSWIRLRGNRTYMEDYHILFYLQKNRESVKLGQRRGLSDSDIKKINIMYQDMCNTDIINVTEQKQPRPEDHLLNIIGLIGQTFGFGNQ